MNEIEMKSRKGQIHRTWSRKLIDEIKEKVEKYDEFGRAGRRACPFCKTPP